VIDCGQDKVTRCAKTPHWEMLIGTYPIENTYANKIPAVAFKSQRETW